ncbi:MAG: tRNA pseudouridine(38-40) synthase TruA [Woeseiaceae bacterium]
MRIALGIEYDGRAFCGWQFQDHSPSVQEVVEKALSKVANHFIRVVCAGRTDTGVHATEQIIHFDTEVSRESYQWVKGVNANLPDSVTILWAQEISDEFHARFKAFRRAYRYVIFSRNTRPSYLNGLVSWDYRSFDEGRMQEAANYLIGEHDFSSYRAIGCQAKSPVRTLHQFDISRHGNFIFLDIEANAFLHHMVRNMAGVLMTIGAGEEEPIWAKEVLELQDRKLGGITAAPYGLYLVRVDYPDEFILPKVINLPSF